MGGRVIIKKNWNVDKEMENMDKEIKQRLDQQFDFIREIDKEKFIGRQTYLTGGTRKDVFCKHFLAKVAKYFWRMLHLQIGESCKASTGSCPASCIAIADQI